MTKYIHVINADSAAWNVVVLVQDKVYDFDKNVMSGEWETVEELPLSNPGQLQTRYLTSSRRLVIEERGLKPA